MRDFFNNNDMDDESAYDIQEIMGGVMSEYATEMHVNRLILESSLRLLERSFGWRFRFHSSKMRLLEDTYHRLKQLIVADLDEGEMMSEQDFMGNDEFLEEDDDESII